MTTEVKLPHWDLTVVYPSLQSPEFEVDYRSIIEEVGRLGDQFDRYGVEKQENLPVDGATIDAFETIVGQMLELAERLETLGAFIAGHVAVNSRDDLAQAKMSELQQHMVLLAQLQTRVTAWIGSMDVEALIEQSALARDHAFMLRQTNIQAQHLMSPAEEALQAELEVTGGSAWGKLHGNVTSQLTVRLEFDGEQRDVPMSVARNQAYDPDRENRRTAYEAELEGWEQVEVPLAAALNSVKGETNTVEERRGWGTALDYALFLNNIDRPTLDAMLQAAREAFPDFRRYLRAKARVLGLRALAWYDIFAPLEAGDRSWAFDEAIDFMLEQFGTYSWRLRDFAARALNERWIDAEPRPGKRDGAFCMKLRPGESRILANYRPSYDGMSTLAHELGHGYHNLNLKDRTPFQRSTPMTLAETASIFCETIVKNAALQHSGGREQMAILEADLQGTTQVVVDITSRFLFESRVFERRHQRELSVEELKNLMLETQRETYGDGLESTLLHPYMWAVKGHYYSTGRPFYNFPYMFGLLFGLGLYAQYQQRPEGFQARYDDLLSSTGLADAATLAQSFGIDIRAPEFWRSSLDIVRHDIDRFESLVEQTTGS